MIAALANPEARRVLGLLDTSGDAPRLRVQRFAELLAAAPVERPTGIERFVINGRLEQYPVGADDRLSVLQYLIDRAMPDSVERVDERTLTERLAT